MSEHVFVREGIEIRLVDRTTGKILKEGDEVTSFREETGTLSGVGRFGRLGDVKIIVNGIEYNASVWNVACIIK